MGGKSSRPQNQSRMQQRNQQKQPQKIDLTQVEKIFQKYGQNGIKTILAKADSQYQSLSYVKITKRCEQLVNNIEDQGDEMIDNYKAQSQKDFQQTLKALELKREGIVKETQITSRKSIRQIFFVDQQIAKYEDIRVLMKQKFQDQRFELKNAIKEETRRNQKLDLNKDIPEFDNKSKEQKDKMIQQAEEKYGKKWLQQQKEQRLLARQGKKILSNKIYQFDFSHNHRPKFENIIPKKECQQKRDQVKKSMEQSASEALSAVAICC